MDVPKIEEKAARRQPKSRKKPDIPMSTNTAAAEVPITEANHVESKNRDNKVDGAVVVKKHRSRGGPTKIGQPSTSALAMTETSNGFVATTEAEEAPVVTTMKPKPRKNANSALPVGPSLSDEIVAKDPVLSHHTSPTTMTNKKFHSVRPAPSKCRDVAVSADGATQLLVSEVTMDMLDAQETPPINHIIQSKNKALAQRKGPGVQSQAELQTNGVDTKSLNNTQTVVNSIKRSKSEPKKGKSVITSLPAEDLALADAVPALTAAVAQLTIRNGSRSTYSEKNTEKAVNIEVVHNKQEIAAAAECDYPSRYLVGPAWNQFLDNSMRNLQSASNHEYKHGYQRKLCESMLVFLDTMDNWYKTHGHSSSLVAQLLDEYQITDDQADLKAVPLRQLSSVAILLMPTAFPNSRYTSLVFGILMNAARHVLVNDLMDGREVR
jgi:hypothetical protein